MIWQQSIVLGVLAIAAAIQGSFGCTSGFIDRNLLSRRASKIDSEDPAGVSFNLLRNFQFLVIPGMNFSCSGTITGYLLGVDKRNLPGHEARIDLWRPQVQSGQIVSYSIVSEANRFISLKPGDFSTDGVIHFDIKDEISFQQGDVLGVCQASNGVSRTRLFYTDVPSPPLAFDVNLDYHLTSTISSSGHAPFYGTVLIRPVTDNDSCLNGFLSESELRQQILQVNINGVVSRPRQQRLFPDIQLTCNGFITKWIIGVQIRTTGITTESPEMQIWRRLAAENTYTKVGSSHLTNGVARNSNVIEYTPVSPVEFQVGDIPGVFQSRADHSNILLYYQHGTGPENYGYTGDTPLSTINPISPKIAYDYPLLSVKVTQEAVSQFESSSSPTPTVRLVPAQEGSHMFTTAIVVIAAVVVLVTVSVVTVVVCLAVLRHQKHQSSSSSMVVVVDKDVASRNEVLNMKENACYNLVRQKTPNENIVSVFDKFVGAEGEEHTPHTSAQEVPYYAKVTLQRTFSTTTESAIRSIAKENVLLHENIVMNDHMEQGHVATPESLSCIVMVENVAYDVHSTGTTI